MEEFAEGLGEGIKKPPTGGGNKEVGEDELEEDGGTKECI